MPVPKTLTYQLLADRECEKSMSHSCSEEDLLVLSYLSVDALLAEIGLWFNCEMQDKMLVACV